MEPISPVSGELNKLWHFLDRMDFFDDEMEAWYRRQARFSLPKFIENVDRLERFLASEPDVYVLQYTVAVVMERELTDTGGKAERAVLHAVVDLCNQIIYEVERQEKEQ